MCVGVITLDVGRLIINYLFPSFFSIYSPTASWARKKFPTHKSRQLFAFPSENYGFWKFGVIRVKKVQKFSRDTLVILTERWISGLITQIASFPTATCMFMNKRLHFCNFLHFYEFGVHLSHFLDGCRRLLLSGIHSRIEIFIQKHFLILSLW